jgi:TonB family protein
MKRTSLVFGVAIALVAMLIQTESISASGKLIVSDPSENVTASANDTSDIASATAALGFNASYPKAANGLDLHSFLSNVIDYPALALEEGLEGRVRVVCTIEANGKVSAIKVLDNVDRRLSDAVVQKVKSMTFQPAVQNGFAIRNTLLIPVTFKLL